MKRQSLLPITVPPVDRAGRDRQASGDISSGSIAASGYFYDCDAHTDCPPGKICDGGICLNVPWY
ncbi:hypothetical protein Lepto7375DRAFT_5515 [Leptolyngbya sp. PCC 7375]|nr:hypothetical protein Lepto7375DRAFT_5515 [Leptolyngbya sp. PCC 7375]